MDPNPRPGPSLQLYGWLGRLVLWGSLLVLLLLVLGSWLAPPRSTEQARLLVRALRLSELSLLPARLDTAEVTRPAAVDLRHLPEMPADPSSTGRLLPTPAAARPPEAAR